jgi:purine-binding chemotaxis protein CheW
VVTMPGRSLSVVNLRFRLGLPRKEIALSDRFIVTRTNRSSLIVIADAVIGVVAYQPGELVPVRRVLPEAASVDGVVCFADGLSYIHDLDAFLALDEVGVLSSAERSA